MDTGTLGNVERTPQGGVKAPAYLTRTGIFEYSTDQGRILREYRPPHEVFHADAVKTLSDAPVTNDHPPEYLLHPGNFKHYAVGHVVEVKQDGDKIAASLVIQDADAISAIGQGRREVSCGYHCDVEATPGTLDDGTRYDRIQRNIRYNHVAIVDHGRAGSEVRLRLDSAGNALVPKENHMKIELIEGIEYDVGSPAHRAACERRDAKTAELTSRLDSLNQTKAEAAAQAGRADAAEQRMKELEQALRDARSPKQIAELVAVRTRVVERANKILGPEVKTDGLSNDEIKLQVVQREFPDLRLDRNDSDPKVFEAYIDGLFQATTGNADSKPRTQRRDGLDRLREAATPLPTQIDTKAKTPEEVRADALDLESSRWQRPLAMSKRDPMKALTNQPLLQSAQMETMN